MTKTPKAKPAPTIHFTRRDDTGKIIVRLTDGEAGFEAEFDREHLVEQMGPAQVALQRAEVADLESEQFAG